ncbi:MAG: DUF1674 domain-containing protein [Halofilum sp. (in: g-proteobacteria)]|nr:DUF1674 domain-containing protein [Halofilum sp. (in: g-proteobacteria)]
MDPRAADPPEDESTAADTAPTGSAEPPAAETVEIGGPNRLEPTRYGDWEKNGRCIDF